MLIIVHMPRPRSTPRLLVALSIAAVFAACDGGPEEDVAADAHPPRSDVGPCGPLPTVFCFEGAMGRACGDVSALMVCDGKYWQCPESSVVPSECGCRIGPSDGGASKKPGDACDPRPDAGGESRDAGDAGDTRDSGDAGDTRDSGDAGDHSPP